MGEPLGRLRGAADLPGVEERRRHLTHGDGFVTVALVDETGGQPERAEPDPAKVRPERIDPQRGGVLDGLVAGHPRFDVLQRGQVEAPDRRHQLVVGRWSVGEVSAAKPLHLAVVSSEQDDGRPADAASLMRVPQIERLQHMDTTGVAEDGERQTPARGEGGVAFRRIDRDRGYISAELVEQREVVCQLDQLAAAVRSPVSPVDDQGQGAIGAAKC